MIGPLNDVGPYSSSGQSDHSIRGDLNSFWMCANFAPASSILLSCRRRPRAKWGCSKYFLKKRRYRCSVGNLLALRSKTIAEKERKTLPLGLGWCCESDKGVRAKSLSEGEGKRKKRLTQRALSLKETTKEKDCWRSSLRSKHQSGLVGKKLINCSTMCKRACCQRDAVLCRGEQFDNSAYSLRTSLFSLNSALLSFFEFHFKSLYPSPLFLLCH